MRKTSGIPLLLRFLIVGAGGIGGYYAAWLLHAGHEVVLSARGAHLTGLQEYRLTVQYGDEIWSFPVQARGHAGVVARCRPDDFDVVLIALKSTATEVMLKELGPWLYHGTAPVLSLQNGVDNEPEMASLLGEHRVLGGLAVRIGGHTLQPGVVAAEGPAQIVMGEWPAAALCWSVCKPPLKPLEYRRRSPTTFATNSGASAGHQQWR